MRKVSNMFAVVSIILILLTCSLSFSTSDPLTCSPSSVENYLQKHTNASREVSQLVYYNIIQSNTTEELPAAVGSNLTSNDTVTRLYSELTAKNNVTESEKGLNNFKNALNEITDSYFTACKGADQTAQGNNKDMLVNSFVNQLAAGDKTTSDYSNIRNNYGKILCHQVSSEQQSNEKTLNNHNQKQKRASSLTDCASSLTVQDLHDCLDPFDVWPCIFNIDPLNNDCPSSQNTSNTRARNCLAFVVDTTGSMAEEIVAARQIVQQFIQSEENILTLCYVLVSFNDYWRSDPIDNLEFYKIYDANYLSSDQNSRPHFNVSMSNSPVPVYGTDILLNDVNNLIANGGFDCPEFGMIGILKAIELINGINDPEVKSLGKHNVIVLTDASAYDNNLYPYVIGNATDPNGADITVHFFFSDDYGCGCCGYGNYPDIANATCGFAVHSINAQAFTQFAGYLYAAQQQSAGGVSVNSCVERRAGNQTGNETGSLSGNDLCKSFNVSEFATKFSILIQGSDNNPVMTVTYPNGSIENINILGDFTVYEKETPHYGQWTVCLSVGRVVEFSLSVKEERPKFRLQYVDYYNMQFYPTDQLPFSCDLMYFIINTDQLDKIDFNESLTLQLVTTVNNTVSVEDETELIHCANTIIGSITAPSTTAPVYYRILGKGVDGTVFQEKVSNIDHVQFPKAMLLLTSSVNESIYMSPNGQTKFQYMIASESRTDQISVNTYWSLQGNGSTLYQSSPIVQSITKNDPQYVNITLNLSSMIIPNTALTNQEYTWTLTAINLCDNQTYSFSLPAALGPPLTIRASNSCSADMTVTWSSHIGAGINMYDVSLKFKNGTISYFNSLPSLTNLVVSNLPYKESIEVRVKTSGGGQDMSYLPYIMWTNGQVPSSPRSARVSQKDNSSFNAQLAWLPPDCWNSKTIHYIVHYKNEQGLGWNIQSVSSTHSGIDTIVQVSITNLQPGKNIFKVAGVNAVGIGTMSNEVTLQITPPRIAELPKDGTTKVQTSIIVVTTVTIPICLVIILALSCVALVFLIMLRRKKSQLRNEEQDLWYDDDEHGSSSSQFSMNSLSKH